VNNEKVLSDPFYQMVFEGSFDELVQEIRCQEFMNVSACKGVSEWLNQNASENRKDEATIEINIPRYQSGSRSHPRGCQDQNVE
jgi:hypothetical protein